VVRIDTSLKPVELLDTLHAIEDGLGRVRRGPRFGPRVIDLDLLLFDNVQSTHGERPMVPHPRMHQRRFVLEPLVELDPDALIPGYGRASAMLAACVAQRVERIQ
jgi:2-amino-4-hydroxy-6-hydroxymethyldihydropteridine diphosphokinase